MATRFFLNVPREDLKHRAQFLLDEFNSLLGDMWAREAINSYEDECLYVEALRDMLQDPNSWRE